MAGPKEALIEKPGQSRSMPLEFRPLSTFPELWVPAGMRVKDVPSGIVLAFAQQYGVTDQAHAYADALRELRYVGRKYGIAPRERTPAERLQLVASFPEEDKERERDTDPDKIGGTITVDGHSLLLRIGHFRGPEVMLAWVETFPGLVNKLEPHALQLSHRHYDPLDVSEVPKIEDQHATPLLQLVVDNAKLSA